MELQDYIEQKLVHEIHTSERRSFRACRRRWDWLFREGYYPIVTAKPLEFGTAFHKAMEVYYDPKTWSWDKEVVGASAIAAFVNKCEKQKNEAIETTGHLYLEGEQELDYEERVELGKGMLKYYFEDVAPKLDRGWTPVAVEIGFMVAIPNPETGEEVIWCECDRCWDRWTHHEDFAERVATILAECATCKENHERFGYEKWLANDAREGHWNGLPVVYAGRLDMLAKDENGFLWIFDWKTARSIPDDHTFLYLDDQVGSYVWALRRGLGIDVKGFVYREIRKGFPQPPKQNKVRRLGRIFSVAQNQDTDYDTYLATVSEQDKQAFEDGLYDEFLEFLKNEGVVYFSNNQIAKSQFELDEIERNIGYEALDMIDSSLRIYPSAGRFGCSFCAFREPCMEKNSGGDYQYGLDTLFEVREPYYIRAEASTESKGGE